MRLRYSIVAGAFLLTWICGGASGQCVPTLARGPEEMFAGADGPVLAFTTFDPDGSGPLEPQLIIGGQFQLVGDQQCPGIMAWDGHSLHQMGKFAGVAVTSATTFALTVFRGELYAAGSFTPSNTLGPARWTGSSWFHMTNGPHGKIYSMAVYKDELYVGGGFPALSGIAGSRCIARWDGTAWKSVKTGASSDVRALTVYNGELVAGGSFQSAGSVQALKIASWDGTNWKALGAGIPNLGVLDTVHALAVHDGALYAGGTFLANDNLRADLVAKWDGVAWSAVGEGLQGDSGALVDALHSHDGSLYAGGTFTRSGSTQALGIARWDGAKWNSVGAGADRADSASERSVRALETYRGELVAGGEFGILGDTYSLNLARWNGGEWKEFCRGLGGIPIHYTVYRGNVVATGEIVGAGGRVARNLGQWDGERWSPMGPGFDGPTADTIVDGENLFVGGSFGHIGDRVASNIVRFDGVSWDEAGSGFDGNVNCFAKYGDSVVAGGKFLHSGAVPAARIALWDGAEWEALGAGLPGEVTALAQFGGKLIAAGVPDDPNNTRAYIRQWDGTTWTDFPALPYSVDARPTSLFAYEGGLFFTYDHGRILRYANGAWKVFVMSNHSQFAAWAVHRGELFMAGGNIVVNDAISNWVSGGLAKWNGSDFSLVPEVSNTPFLSALASVGRTLVLGGAPRQRSIANPNPDQFYVNPIGAARYVCHCPADLNGDEFVNEADFCLFVVGYNQMVYDDSDIASVGASDLNADGVVDDRDFQLFVGWYDAMVCPAP